MDTAKDNDIRSALLDNARLFGDRHRRDGVTLHVEIDGQTYTANTDSDCWRIADICAGLKSCSAEDLEEPEGIDGWQRIMTLRGGER